MKLDKLNVLIAYLPINHDQVFAENNYYSGNCLKMKQSMQSNKSKNLPTSGEFNVAWKNISFKCKSLTFVYITNMQQKLLEINRTQ